LPDAVVTMLFKISKETLELFLDARVKTFNINHEFDEPHRHMKLVISR
jgi:hypothetical protein